MVVVVINIEGDVFGRRLAFSDMITDFLDRGKKPFQALDFSLL